MTKEKATILYIDDEENNLISFRANFRLYYTILTALSAEEGWALLKTQTIHCILVDQRMPGTSGVEFLEAVVASYPEPIRMLLTGYTDMETVINAINKGNVYKYISKPLDEQALKITIDNAYELYKTRHLLTEKTKNLEKTQQELDRFAYSASHDLREPLTSILGVLQLARQDGHYPENKYFQMIETMVKKLDHFTQSVIDYYVNRKTEKQIKTINFQSLVNDLLVSIKLFRDTSLIDFVLTIQQTKPFNTDEFRLRLILNNLISNAIKYRDKKKEKTIIEILILVENETASILLKDNGRGIHPEHLDKVFKMFYRASVDGKGSGLGLYIVKEAVDKLQGEISISSVIDQGTSFKLIIPSQNPE